MSDAAEAPSVAHEKAVLAALIAYPESFAEHGGYLDPDHFTGQRKAIAEGALKLHRASLPLDSIALRDASGCSLTDIADLIGEECAPPNVAFHIDALRAAYFDHRSRAIALAMLKEDEPLPAHEAAGQLTALSASVSGLGWGAFATGADAYHTLPSERPPSLVGDGLLSRGDLGIMYGEGGKGKSYLALQLAHAVATGAEWVGIPGPETPMHAGVVALEVPRHVMLDRINAVCGGPGPPTLRCIAMNDMPRPDLMDPGAQRGLVSWIRADQLDLVVLDAMSRFWGGGKELDDAGNRMAICDTIRQQTGCAILWIHHERKPGPGQSPDDDLAALRSSTRYQTDPTVLLRLTTAKGLTVLRCAKSNFAAIPDPIYLARNPDGTLVSVAAPETKSDKNRAEALRLVAQSTGISPATIQDQTGWSRTTVYRHLKALEREGKIENVGVPASPVYRFSGAAFQNEGETSPNLREENGLDAF